MAVEVAMEDELFFADLNRQISLLIDDNDEDEGEDPIISHFPSVSPQDFCQSMICPPILPSHNYVNQENSRREISKGTGVFIPQSSQPRRRYKQQGKRRASYFAKSKQPQQLTNSKGSPNNNGTQICVFPTYNATNINMY